MYMYVLLEIFGSLFYVSLFTFRLLHFSSRFLHVLLAWKDLQTSKCGLASGVACPDRQEGPVLSLIGRE